MNQLSFGQHHRDTSLHSCHLTLGEREEEGREGERGGRRERGEGGEGEGERENTQAHQPALAGNKQWHPLSYRLTVRSAEYAGKI